MIHESAGTKAFAFLITAAGSGTRMGGGIKKEFRLLDGQPVLAVTLNNFLSTSLFRYGVITCKPGTCDKVKELLSGLDEIINRQGVKLRFCDGGGERQESVRLGIECLANNFPDLRTNGWVLIHDGARPWTAPELITAVAEGCMEHSACAPVIPSIDAMKKINEVGIITGHLPRKETVSVQTPQGFEFNKIRNAHNRASADRRHYIDDTEIFSRYEGDVYTVTGSNTNRKITYEEDITGTIVNGVK